MRGTSGARTFEDGRRWMRHGTELLQRTVDGLDEEQFPEPSGLPEWTRKHLVGHLAANAEALGSLVHWAATGIETPMYASPEERAAGIAKGATLSPDALRAWLRSSSATLAEAMDRLDEAAWQRPVVTAQGRTVPATELPWMRTREVYVHTVDLGTGVGFADLPEDFQEALIADIAAKRGLEQLPDGPLPEVTAWLAGRPHRLTDAPDLGPWL